MEAVHPVPCAEQLVGGEIEIPSFVFSSHTTWNDQSSARSNLWDVNLLDVATSECPVHFAEQPMRCNTQSNYNMHARQTQPF